MPSNTHTSSSELLPDSEVKELLARIGRKEKQAFDLLYELTGTMLYSIAYSLMGGEVEAKDAFQDSLVKIWNRSSSYDPTKGNAVAWLARLTRNTCLDRLRARKRLHAAIDRAAEEATTDTSLSQSKGPSPESAEELLISKELAQKLSETMEKLPPDQREAIELAFLKGMTQTEVADRLNVPLGTVKARIRRGMLKMQASLRSLPQ